MSTGCPARTPTLAAGPPGRPAGASTSRSLNRTRRPRPSTRPAEADASVGNSPVRFRAEAERSPFSTRGPIPRRSFLVVLGEDGHAHDVAEGDAVDARRVHAQ